MERDGLFFRHPGGTLHFLIQISVYHTGAGAPKAPLCKGGCQKSLIFDWGIVQESLADLPKTNANTILHSATIPPSACSADTSLYTREALAGCKPGTINSNLKDTVSYRVITKDSVSPIVTSCRRALPAKLQFTHLWYYTQYCPICKHFRAKKYRCLLGSGTM